MPEDILSLIGRLRAEEAEFCLATVVRTRNVTAARPGAKAVILPDGTLQGFVSGGCVVGAVKRAAQAALDEGAPRLIRVLPHEEMAAGAQAAQVEGVALHGSGCPSGGTVDVFIEPMRQPPLLLVCGGSPVAVACADLGHRLGYRVLVSAADADLAAFAPAYRRVPAWRWDGLDLTRAFIIVATQGRGDKDALRAALAARPRYIGFVASRRKAGVVRRRLEETGEMPAEAFAVLSAPAGLSIEAIEPEEIALSILAEVVSRRRRTARVVEGREEATLRA